MKQRQEPPLQLIDKPEIIESPINEIALELARNAQYLTPEAQNALALYIEVMSNPIINVVPNLLEGKE
jgi:hypothetical protein